MGEIIKRILVGVAVPAIIAIVAITYNFVSDGGFYRLFGGFSVVQHKVVPINGASPRGNYYCDDSWRMVGCYTFIVPSGGSICGSTITTEGSRQACEVSQCTVDPNQKGWHVTMTCVK